MSDALGEGVHTGSASSRRLSMEEAKEAEEAALNDENLCQICFNREIDTAYKPC